MGAADADDAGDVTVWPPGLAYLDVPEHVAGKGQRRADGVPAGEELVDVGRRQLESGVAGICPGGRELAPVVKAGNSAHCALQKPHVPSTSICYTWRAPNCTPSRLSSAWPSLARSGRSSRVQARSNRAPMRSHLLIALASVLGSFRRR